MVDNPSCSPTARPRRISAAALQRRTRVSALSATLLIAAACGGSSASPAPQTDTSQFEGPPFFEQFEAPSETPMGSTDGVGGLVDGPAPSGKTNVPEDCVISKRQAEIIVLPVDIILLLDNSGSMSDELEAVEANINVNFAAILAESNVDYRLILISRHREEPRDESDEASTSICVSAPLSGLENCDDADEPVNSERFLQYSTKLESTDSFDVLLDTYAPPFDEDRDENYDHAPLGWSEWLRPGAKKVFLEMTDDDEDMSVEDFVSALQGVSPEQFGSDPAHPSFVFHSIIGLAEKETPSAAYLPEEPVQEATCTGNDNDVENAGQTYQELSRLTGGLRFPLCQFDAYDVVFQTIAEDVVLTRGIECDFEIPEGPRGLELDPDTLAIEYSPGDGAASVTFGQTPGLDTCRTDAFYVAAGRVNLCPDTCTAIRSDPAASMTVLYTCQSQLLVPR
jgi:hypothetical protein